MNNIPKINRLKPLRHLTWGALVIVVVASAGHLAWRTLNPSNDPARVVVTGEALIKSQFSLIDHTGQRVSELDYRDRWQLVFFGFTYCPDICPTTLSYVANILDLLGGNAEHVAPLFITVDPARDTQEVMAEYVSVFHPQLIGLTGSEAEVASAAQSFRVFFEKRTDETVPDGYLMAHSGYIYLMTPDGKYEAIFLEGRETPETVAEQIQLRIEKEYKS
ncbi:SCO family protein [Parasedimentitalea psychrophila]|uniref:SCO family protein n=1 Tax=Parasedimentitalea psychrophila TaxID=2997337 RepID=A0A9Y2L1L8_9RHOB|nr:SCO family protein [Parasedimentitalea psychrophila]WIY25717.1 SCO family protein [Parasedimentitalea psychrophila]